MSFQKIRDVEITIWLSSRLLCRFILLTFNEILFKIFIAYVQYSPLSSPCKTPEPEAPFHKYFFSLDT